MPRHKMETLWKNLPEQVGWVSDLETLRKFVLLICFFYPNEGIRDDFVSQYFMGEVNDSSSLYNNLKAMRESMAACLSLMIPYGWLDEFIDDSGFRTEGEILQAMGYDLEDIYVGNYQGTGD